MSRPRALEAHSESDLPMQRPHRALRPAAVHCSSQPARPLVSVLTPTRLLPQRIDFLQQLHTDLCASEVDWEWIVAVDGEHDRRVPPALLADERVHSFQIGQPVGTASARNLALGMARGVYVTSADDDDHLPIGSLECRLTAAAANGVGWVAGRLAHLRDGEVVVYASPVPAGPSPAGSVWRAWACPCLDFPIGPTTMLIEAGLLRSVGGWQGLPQAEDLGMVLAVTGRAAGMMLDQVVYTYRAHPEQMTTQVGFADLEPLVRHITYERGRLLSAASWTGQPTSWPVQRTMVRLEVDHVDAHETNKDLNRSDEPARQL
ncbi:glycosyltransferase family 2 protein [Leekyejoonella antrihumi]|uniref:glycosyltransferase family 2 protein n=1 Tax=Leekyejoonella antrihumi TaxID=1660198 RepID=UPI001648556F|nr:glycosyltransferase family A protein [Leekyejoonella antrihumi]